MQPSENEVKAFATVLIDNIQEYVRQKYRLRLFDLGVRLDFSERRRISWGGKRDGQEYISLSLRSFTKGRNSLKEYAHIARDPQIGSVYDVTWKHALAVLITHEIAHAVKAVKYSTGCVDTNRLVELYPSWPSYDIKPHGELWQMIYRDLRGTYVNNFKYDKLTYAIPASVPVQQPISGVKKPRAYYTKEVNRDGGRHAIYYRTSDGILLGRLFKRENGVVHFAKDGDKYERTSFRNVTEARKALIEPLI